MLTVCAWGGSTWRLTVTYWTRSAHTA